MERAVVFGRREPVCGVSCTPATGTPAHPPQPRGRLHLLRAHRLLQPHARVRLGQADEGLQLAWRGNHHLALAAVAAHVGVHGHKLGGGRIGQRGLHAGAGVRDVVAEEVLGDGLLWKGGRGGAGA